VKNKKKKTFHSLVFSRDKCNPEDVVELIQKLKELPIKINCIYNEDNLHLSHFIERFILKIYSIF